jgi:HNH endonuclease
MPELTVARLKSLLRYEPETGDWFWIVDRGAHVFAGDRAGRLAENGYIQIGIDRSQYWAHRLAFLYMLGRWPTDKTDHINRIKSDNRWCNLRDATHAQNMRNRSAPARKKYFDLPRGVVEPTGRAKFPVYIRSKWLGGYYTVQEASAVYEAAARERYGEFYCEVSPPPPPPPFPRRF